MLRQIERDFAISKKSDSKGQVQVRFLKIFEKQKTENENYLTENIYL